MYIYVDNVSPATSLSDLRGYFEIYGEVTKVTISTLKTSGALRRQGRVEMPSDHHGHAAVAGMHGRELGGIPLTVREEV